MKTAESARGYCDWCNSKGGAMVTEPEGIIRFEVCEVCKGSRDEGAPEPVILEFDGKFYRLLSARVEKE